MSATTNKQWIEFLITALTLKNKKFTEADRAAITEFINSEDGSKLIAGKFSAGAAMLLLTEYLKWTARHGEEPTKPPEVSRLAALEKRVAALEAADVDQRAMLDKFFEMLS